jgi:Cytochrome c554 and c-prime
MATPVWMRVEVPPGGEVHRFLEVRLAAGGTILAAEADCACIRVTTGFPLVAPPGQSTRLGIRVAGVRPGTKTITIRTSAGSITAAIQVVTQGLGSGRDQLERILAGLATEPGTQLWCLIHDLRGRALNCGCSEGSLGGVDHLAALPGWVAQVAPQLHTRFYLTGDVAGAHSDVATALLVHGWSLPGAEVAVDALALTLDDPAIVVAIPAPGHQLPSHTKVVIPLMDQGSVIIVLGVRNGRIVDRWYVPVDGTLPALPIRGLGMNLLPRAQAATQATCGSCHPAATKAWAGSRHSHAWDSLKVEDTTTDCQTCHTTERKILPNLQSVQCQACHLGTEPHEADPHQRTTGLVECRSCHDAVHHPSFDPIAAWAKVAHGL